MSSRMSSVTYSAFRVRFFLGNETRKRVSIKRRGAGRKSRRTPRMERIFEVSSSRRWSFCCSIVSASREDEAMASSVRSSQGPSSTEYYSSYRQSDVTITKRAARTVDHILCKCKLRHVIGTEPKKEREEKEEKLKSREGSERGGHPNLQYGVGCRVDSLINVTSTVEWTVMYQVSQISSRSSFPFSFSPHRVSRLIRLTFDGKSQIHSWISERDS
jgi:hypothetical protein